MDELILQLTSEYGISEDHAEGIFDTIRVFLIHSGIPYSTTSLSKQRYGRISVNNTIPDIENHKEIKLNAIA